MWLVWVVKIEEEARGVSDFSNVGVMANISFLLGGDGSGPSIIIEGPRLYNVEEFEGPLLYLNGFSEYTAGSTDATVWSGWVRYVSSE